MNFTGTFDSVIFNKSIFGNILIHNKDFNIYDIKLTYIGNYKTNQTLEFKLTKNGENDNEIYFKGNNNNQILNLIIPTSSNINVIKGIYNTFYPYDRGNISIRKI